MYSVPYGNGVLLLPHHDLAKTLSSLGITNYWLDGERIRLRLPGGKGGFGSQLRAQGNKMSQRRKREGVDSCRDLQGRRLRTVKESQQIAEYLQRLPELERKKQEEITKKMEKQVELAERKPKFKDVGWQRKVEEVVGETELTVLQALERSRTEGGKGKGKEKCKLDYLEQLEQELLNK